MKGQQRGKPAGDATLDAAHDDAPPRPSALIESLRAFGYTLQTALADLIDNSIAARARNVWLDTEWDGHSSRIMLLDDGDGMTEAQLLEAMRPGSQSPLEDRAAHDLGRFGLGLKTASFSQCRCLTVASKQGKGPPAVRRWDLDFVRDTNQWWVLKSPTERSADQIDRLAGLTHGTLVVWEQLDRAIGLEGAESEGAAGIDDLKKHFNHAIAREVKPHLAMVFHRFIDGDAPRLTIHINGSKLAAWDPFQKHSARITWPAEPVSYRAGIVVRPKPFVMPHKDKLTSEEHRAMAGPAGWNAQQGFYVYRKKRLLVAGSWLGLGFTKDEHVKLARIQLDMPDGTDSEWSIDVKKSTASPPPAIRDGLARVARLAREKAEDVYRHRAGRGAHRAPTEIIRIWRELTRNGRRAYRLNRDHALLTRALELPKQHRPAVEALLKVIEETVPVHEIWLDQAKDGDNAAIPFASTSEKEILAIVEQLYLSLREQNYRPEEARRRLEQYEHIGNYPHLIARMKD